MKVALAFHQGDVRLARNLLVWIGQLGGVKAHDCVLVSDFDTDYQETLKCLEAASGAFASARLVSTDAHTEGWIPGSNDLFLTAAKACAGSPFLFLEPDATPMSADWLDAIQAAYAACGKPYIGSLVTHSTPGWPNPYLEGVAVYPADANEKLSPLVNKTESWTRTCSPLTVPLAVNSPLFHHLWGEKGLAPVFAEKNVPGTNVFCLRQVRPEAKIFHRCKDGSLIQQLRKARSIATQRIGPSAIVSLRRAGDIINLLPLLKRLHDHNNGLPVRLVVHREFVPLLEGVSYVSTVAWDGGWEDCLEAAAVHSAVNCQVFGKGVRPDIRRTNFAAQAWEKAGYVWDRHAPLVFDRRNFEREEKLAASVFKTQLPKLLLKLHGFSSPFGDAAHVRASLVAAFQNQAEIVTLDEVKADRLFDLIGLMDRAACLVSIDTVALWLAHASKCPNIAIVNGTGFAASPPRGNCLLRVPYARAKLEMSRIVDLVSKSLRAWEQSKSGANGIVHVVSDFIPSDEFNRKRVEAASSTWNKLGARLVRFKPKRDSTVIGDPRKLPFVRDMISEGFKGGESILVITNNDIAFDDRLAAEIKASCEQFGCYWAYRLECPGGKTDEGADCFAMTRGWWEIHQHQFPDLLLGQYWWDDIFVRMMRWSGCRERERLYYHSAHPGVLNRLTTPGAAHNDRVAKQWLAQYGETMKKPEIE